MGTGSRQQAPRAPARLSRTSSNGNSPWCASYWRGNGEGEGLEGDRNREGCSEEVREVLPELRCELGSSVGGDVRRKAVTSNQFTQEGTSHVFVTYASQGDCFWPASDSIHHCEEVCETFREREWPYEIHIHMVKSE